MIRDQSYQHEIVTTIQSVRCFNTFSIIMVYLIKTMTQSLNRVKFNPIDSKIP